MVMRHMGCPQVILQLVAHQWATHGRWATFAGAASRRALLGSRGLPQGDVWAPMALAVVLAPVIRWARHQAPESVTLTYLDDRTILGRSPEDLETARRAWHNLEECRFSPGINRA